MAKMTHYSKGNTCQYQNGDKRPSTTHYAKSQYSTVIVHCTHNKDNMRVNKCACTGMSNVVSTYDDLNTKTIKVKCVRGIELYCKYIVFFQVNNLKYVCGSLVSQILPQIPITQQIQQTYSCSRGPRSTRTVGQPLLGQGR